MARAGNYAAATALLSAADEDFAALIRRIGPCRLQLHPQREPYEALVRAIAYQQLHGKAAEAILGRFIDLYPGTPFPAPAQLLATEQSLLRSVGFSMAKIATIRGIAAATLDGVVPGLREAKRLPDAALIQRLVTLRGVGRWTVEMLLIFTLARPDVLPVDDFGVREGWKRIKGLQAQPRPRALAAIGEAWSPWRSVAAWYLWRAAEKTD
jgi:DNA-3-methyladenine glycosylase II